MMLFFFAFVVCRQLSAVVIIFLVEAVGAIILLICSKDGHAAEWTGENTIIVVEEVAFVVDPL